MSLRELYEAVLIEVNKESAPNITLDDFNYMANKAVYQYVNKRYNIYDISQQTTDDLRVLKATAVLPVTATPYSGKFQIPQGFNFTFMHATYQVELPDDYFHLLNCECFYKVNFTHKCNNKGEVARAKATRLTADAWNQVVDNFWNRPTYNRPYYYIHNVNTSISVPTNPVDDASKRGTDKFGVSNSSSTGSGVDTGSDVYNDSEQSLDPFKTIDISGFITDSGVTYPLKHAQVRYGNASKVLMEIRYGEDDSVYTLFAVMVDYIKAPQHLRLTQTLLDKTLDTSLILEFPDYVCQEITNELVHIIMENLMDPKLLTHPLVSLSIANPAQQLAPETQQQN